MTASVRSSIACILIVTIPFGLQAFKLASYSRWPVGGAVIRRPDAGGASMLGNVLWFVLFGWWLALGHIVTAALLAITIIGLPLAVANIKLVPVALLPSGREIVNGDKVAVLPAVQVVVGPPAR